MFDDVPFGESPLVYICFMRGVFRGINVDYFSSEDLGVTTVEIIARPEYNQILVVVNNKNERPYFHVSDVREIDENTPFSLFQVLYHDPDNNGIDQ